MLYEQGGNMEYFRQYVEDIRNNKPATEITREDAIKGLTGNYWQQCLAIKHGKEPCAWCDWYTEPANNCRTWCGVWKEWQDRQGDKMKIKEIWDRSHLAPKCKSVAIIDSDGHIWVIEPDKIYTGVDTNGKRQYKETGNPYIYDFFVYTKSEGKSFSSKQCYTYLHGLGDWRPIKKFNLNECEDKL